MGNELMSIKEASIWISNKIKKNVTVSNISYLINYGRLKKFNGNGNILVDKNELEKYYISYHGNRKSNWTNELGEDINWHLSFEKYKESETTKHVHRLHPYKGKFIPQLVEYFLDSNTDNFKKEIFFKKGDIVLDPFCGSGTTLVQSNELGIHAIGIDVSAFNSLISNCKILKYDIYDVKKEIDKITSSIIDFISKTNTKQFEDELNNKLYEFNSKYFPSPDYKYKLKNSEIEEHEYGKEKEKEFLPLYIDLVKKYNIKLLKENPKNFIEKWYLNQINDEIEIAFNHIKKIKNINTKKLLSVILSRTIRSCRATTHSDLATLKDPVETTYYCSKHGKICKPIFSILKWWKTYSNDTIKRLLQFDKLKTNTYQICLTGDSRTIDLISELNKKQQEFAELVKTQKIKGIFSSPPYVGLIDYHEQHAYAYDLFGFERRDELEIGPLYKGQGKEARDSYVDGISKVLLNCKNYLDKDYNVFLVANDKYNLYPIIANKSGMKIINQYKRPVLNRTEKDKGAYSEIIFHLKEK
ncbi:MAG: DNA methyltransferase [Melioribacteraceae bacterium]|nr:DNA methyltransferase [Melioribacteraceae bacterium]